MIALIVIASLAALVGGLLLYAHSRPDYVTVARSIRIQASPQAIFPFLEDLRLFGAWSPFEQLDPAAQRRFSGSPRGTGAVYEWDGNDKLGSGRMEIIDTAPAKRVISELEFFRPFKADCLVEFSLQPVSGGTEVRWEMDGARSLSVKLVSLFLDLDGIQGREFEKGLAALKALVEGPVQPRDYWPVARDIASSTPRQAA